MNHLALLLQESHTFFCDSLVNLGTLPKPGVPLSYVGGWGNNSHFGAGLTPLADSILLVYQVVPNHPLNLETGDAVLGYDGIPWKKLYKEIINLDVDNRKKMHLIDKCGDIEFRMTEGSDEFLQLEALLSFITLAGLKE